MSDSDENRRQTLLHMHKFYADEARHQREMMWATARWFVLILGVLFSGIILKLVTPFSGNPQPSEPEILILLIPCTLGYVASLVCYALIMSFYRTNLEYITMYAKVEDELGFDKRTKRESFRTDPFITWQKYRESRQEKNKCSQKFVEEGLKKWSKMHNIMSTVFVLFALYFIGLGVVILVKACWPVTGNGTIDFVIITSFVVAGYFTRYSICAIREFMKAQ